ncbi:DUF6531 domain-containing protein [Streptomyces sp. NPDC057199]|uniref:DUF6531 domain-containing protein n=1 Tax=Streptomyces sp. NPDC057199 TaxID=3346047 RepID=UPI0036446E22
MAALSAGTVSATAAPLLGRPDQGQQAIRSAAGEPVVVDVEVASTGHPFALTRFYHWDPEAPSGLLGKGWRLSFEANLLPSSSAVILDDADGTELVFTRLADGSFIPPDGAAYTLAEEDGSYSLTGEDGTVRTFTAAGRLTGILDTVGKGLRLTYGASGYVASVTDTEGRTAAFATDSAGRLVRVTLADGKRVTYAYSSRGHLMAVAGADGSVRTYTYDAQGRLIV